MPAAQAVRNRKTIFKNLILEQLSKTCESIDLLNVASGPATDIKEIYEIIDPRLLQTTCIDSEIKAIDYAKINLHKYLKNITFYNVNIIRFRSQKLYDVIWSAGLFDYFNDDIFIKVLKQFKDLLKPFGKIIIGNFCKSNPTKDYMELFGNWYLIHRTEGELKELALKAGFLEQSITIIKEELNINLFLVIDLDYNGKMESS
jgi:SAM-dependent methyltransferase